MNCFEETTWASVTVGCIIKVEKDEIIPCDILIIKSSNESGFCYFQTTNLDGESALKSREAVGVINTIVNQDVDLNMINGYVEVDQPNDDIYCIEGTVFIEGFQRNYITISNTLLRVK